LTKIEARQLYKTDRIYWHTSAHCWDNRALGSNEGDNEPKVVAAAVRPATAAAAVRLEIAFPSLIKGDGISRTQSVDWPQVDWFSPWPMLTHPWIWDFDAPDAFTPWHKRIE